MGILTNHNSQRSQGQVRSHLIIQ